MNNSDRMPIGNAGAGPAPASARFIASAMRIHSPMTTIAQRVDMARVYRAAAMGGIGPVTVPLYRAAP